MENTGKKCRWAVKALLALVWLVVAGVVCYAALIGLVYYWEVNVPEPTDYDSIIVLGAQVLPSGEPSVQLRWRLDKAKEYYEKHPCYMVVTGGQGGPGTRPGGGCDAGCAHRGGPERGTVISDPHSADTKENTETHGPSCRKRDARNR